MGIYANNGTGKTFISRAFRLNPLIINLQYAKITDKLLTTGQTKGSLYLNLIIDTDKEKQD